MFEIAWSELFIILIVAIIVVGPKELPGMLRGFGRMVGKLRRSADDFRRQFEDSMREAGGDELTKELNELRRHNPLNEIRNTIEEAAREVSHPSLPTPESKLDKPEEPPVVHETFTETSPELPPPAAAEAAPLAPAPTEPAKEPQVSPGHQPVINGQHRPLS